MSHSIFLIAACAAVLSSAAALACLLWGWRSAGDARAAQARLRELADQLPAAEARVASQDRIIVDLRVAEARALTDADSQRDTAAGLRTEVAAERDARGRLMAEHSALKAELAAARMALQKDQEGAARRMDDLLKARRELSDQFSTIANTIFEEKSKRLTEQNQLNLGHLLDPLKLQLTEFKGKVEEVYFQEGKDRSALAEQVSQLKALNTQLSTDAIGLTNALKGSSKAQGSWGEMVLERILESGGLRKGHEYRVQESYKREDGSRVIPDVILHLPEGRHLVVDAKVSLVDYNGHVNGQSEAERERSAASHVSSVRTHIKGLSEKDYRSLHSLHTVDFVIMFVPIEPAFMLAIGRDTDLWQQAWEKSILLVSPSTLLFVVRTVAHLWNQEQQRDNVKEVMRQGGNLYDKFTDFVADLEGVGERLRKAQESYAAAAEKLSKGKGNLVNRAQSLQKLGVPSKKRLPDVLVRAAAESAGETEGPLLVEEEAETSTGPQSMLLDLAAAADAEISPAQGEHS